MKSSRIEIPKKINLQTLESLAKCLDLSAEQLLDVSDKAQGMYGAFTKKKKDGKDRLIEPPKEELKILQRKIHERLLLPRINSPIAFGAIKGKSYFEGGQRLVKQEVVAKLDIKSFFPYVSNKMVNGLFLKMACHPNVAHHLTKLLTYKGHLPQGSPASPSITNLLLAEFDFNLERFALDRNVRIVRVIDDVATGGSRKEVEDVLDCAIRRLNSMGLKINRKKVLVMPQQKRQEFCGMNVNTTLSVPKEYRSKVRSDVRWFLKFGATDKEIRSLRGKIAYIARTNPNRAEILKSELSKVKINVKSKTGQ